MHARLEGALDPPGQHAPEWSEAKVPVTVTVVKGVNEGYKEYRYQNRETSCVVSVQTKS